MITSHMYKTLYINTSLSLTANNILDHAILRWRQNALSVLRLLFLSPALSLL